MKFPPIARKLALVTHVVASVGWLGAVASYIALALLGLLSDDPENVRAAYVGMAVEIRWVIIPLSLTSFITGVLQSLGTHWGLLRHYWVVFKLVINGVCVAVLLMYAQSIDRYADRSRGALSAADLDYLRDPTHVLHSSVAAGLLLVATVLAVVKPRGLTKAGKTIPRGLAN